MTYDDSQEVPMQAQVTIRMAGPADGPALHVLEELDSRRLPVGDTLVAEVAGEVQAALPVAGGSAVADPFRPTADLVELLAVHAAQVRSVRHASAHQPRALAPLPSR